MFQDATCCSFKNNNTVFNHINTGISNPPLFVTRFFLEICYILMLKLLKQEIQSHTECDKLETPILEFPASLKYTPAKTSTAVFFHHRLF